MVAQRQGLTSHSSFVECAAGQLMNFIADIQPSIHCTKHKAPPNTRTAGLSPGKHLHCKSWCWKPQFSTLHHFKKSQKGVWKHNPMPATVCRDPQHRLSQSQCHLLAGEGLGAGRHHAGWGHPHLLQKPATVQKIVRSSLCPQTLKKAHFHLWMRMAASALWEPPWFK